MHKRSETGATARQFMVAVVAGLLAWALGFPAPAAAHGPVAPIASAYQARVTQSPPGFAAQVIDGDQRLWLQVPAGQAAVVLDYRGAPYLRFSPAGVAVNRNSALYYLNQTPAQTPPAGLGPLAPPRWALVSGGHSYSWHDGRLHALATVALAPGTTYAGRWSIPLRVAGRPAAVSGGVWHAAAPSIVWFWPIVVVLACTLAAWRLHRPRLDQVVAPALSLGALAAITAGALARELHGRPAISVVQWLTLAVTLGFVAWAAVRVWFGRPGYFTYFVIAFVALWQGAELVPTLFDGFVLAAVPAFVARTASAVGLGCGLALLLLVLRLADDARSRGPGAEAQSEVTPDLERA